MERETKIKIWRIIALFGLLMCLLFGVRIISRAQNATSILDKAAAAYEKSNGISASFTLHTRSEIQQVSESFEGTIHMKGDKFKLITPDMTTWFDGATQWSYVDRNEEVNVSTPTGEELQFTNPAVLLRIYKKGFTPKYIGESTASNGKSAYDVELIPKKKSDIRKVELQIEKYSNFPATIKIEAGNGITNTIHISNVKTGVNQPDDFFVFKEGDYPDAEVIDLR